MNIFISYLLLFVIGFVVDVLWAVYIRNVSNDNKLTASTYSVLLGITSIIYIKLIVDTWIGGIFYLIGLYFGTYYSAQIEVFLHSKLKQYFK